MDAPILELESVRRVYGLSGKGVHNLTFKMKHGERVALLGLNGAGKSTTFRLISGLLNPDQGEIRIEDQNILNQRKNCLQKLGYLPENAPLPLELTPRQHLRLECQIRGVRPENQMANLIEACELGDVLDSPIGVLSRGFRKRVALAGSLVHHPLLLLLDEPTAGLDPHQVDQFRRLILNVSERCAVLVSTHVLAEAEAICERCLILHHGLLKDDLPLPCQSTDQFRIQYRGPLSVASFTDLGDDWKESCIPAPESPEQWLAKHIQAGLSVRLFAPIQQSLEHIFLEKTQKEDLP